jgi:signal recognition particle subunit SRP54
MPDPSKMSPAEMEAMAKGMQEGLGGGMPGGLKLPGGLSGLGGFGKKK